MPIVAASNGIKPYIRALAVIELNKPVTPEAINSCVGTGDYAAKYISKLRKDGFVFTVQKDSRTIVSYTLISEPDCAASYRAMKPKQKVSKDKSAKIAKSEKVVKATKKAVAKKEKTPEEIAAKNLETMKKVSAKLAKRKAKKKKVVDYVEDTFGTSGEIATSFNIDPGWDSTEGLDIKKLVA